MVNYTLPFMNQSTIWNSVFKELCLPSLVKFSNNHYGLSFNLMKAIPAVHVITNEIETIRRFHSNRVIESSSGTFGLGLAYICKYFDLELKIITDPIVNQSLKNYFESLGVEVVMIDTSPSSENVQQLRKQYLVKELEMNKSFWPKQYYNDLIHQSYKIILDSYDYYHPNLSQVTDLVLSVGSGGSSLGLSSWLNSKLDYRLQMHAVDSANSSLFGREAGPRTLRGLGSSIPMPFTERCDYSSIFICNDSKTITLCKSLLSEHGLFKGPTSGVTYACGNHLAKCNPDRVILSILPDNGFRYLDTVYSLPTVNLDSIKITPMAKITDSFQSHIGHYQCK